MPYKGLLYGQVVERVVVSKRRPEMPQYVPQRYASLAERCWAHDPKARPTFETVLSELRDMAAAAPELQAEIDEAAAVSVPEAPLRAKSILGRAAAAAMVRQAAGAAGAASSEDAEGGLSAAGSGGPGAAREMAQRAAGGGGAGLGAGAASGDDGNIVVVPLR